MATLALLTILCSATLIASAPAPATTTAASASTSCSRYVVRNPFGYCYFKHHKHHDFRWLTGYPPAPPQVTTHGDQEDDDYLQWLYRSIPGFDVWTLSTSMRYGIGYGWPIENSMKNFYIVQENTSDYNTYFRMRTYRLDAFQSGAELLTKAVMNGASIRFLGRMGGDPGAVAGFFTYADDDNESDMELRTMDDATMYHYNTQPSDTKGASFDIDSMPAWTDWHVHRLDWYNGGIAWYIDDVVVSQSTVNVPKKASTARLNMWGAGTAFSGKMRVGGLAWLDMQWIEIVYNDVTDDDDDSSSKVKRMLSTVDSDSSLAKRAVCWFWPWCGSGGQGGQGGQGGDDDDQPTTTAKTTSTSSSVKTTSTSSTSSSVKTSSTSSTSSSVKTTSTSSSTSTSIKTTSTSSTPTSSTKSSTSSSATPTQTFPPGTCSIDNIDGVPNAKGQSS